MVTLTKKAVDYAAKFFPQYNRVQLAQRIELGRAVQQEKLNAVGVERPLEADELENIQVFLRYELFNTATADELSFLETEGINIEGGEPDPEVDGKEVADFLKDLAVEDLG